MACCSRSSPASRCSADCASCAAACATPVVPMRCSRSCGAAPHFTLAPTALAALAAARAGARCFITDPAVLPARLKPLPLAVLRWPEEHNARLAAMGVRTLGELCVCHAPDSPGASVPQLLADLDRLLGNAPIRARASRPGTLSRRARSRSRNPGSRTHPARARAVARASSSNSCARASAASRPAMPLSSLPCRPDACVLRLARPRRAPRGSRRCCASGWRISCCPSRCAAASSRAARSRARRREPSVMVAGRTWLRAHGRDARAGRASARAPRRGGGIRPHGGLRASARARLARGRAADGGQIIRGQICDRPKRICPRRRPLWLLHRPETLDARRGRPRYGGALKLLEGPERIESGWWDGADIQRDYYTAQTAAGARLWIYRECAGDARVVPARDLRVIWSSATAPAYAELHCLSNFSFLRGASHAEELVAQARELGYTALAITDECSFAGVVRAHSAVKKIGGGIKLLIGTELNLERIPARDHRPRPRRVRTPVAAHHARAAGRGEGQLQAHARRRGGAAM